MVQASPPPPSIPEQPIKEEAKKVKKDSPKKVQFYILALRFSVCTVVTVLSRILIYTHRKGLAGWVGSLGKERMKLTCQMTKISL